MNPIRCTRDSAAAILGILNEEIVSSTTLYDYRPRDAASMETWFETKEKGRYPVIGIESADGGLMGFASYGAFRNWPAYKYSIEHSVYVDKRFRGQGVGRFLLKELMAVAAEQQYHMMIGGIDGANLASLQLHRSLGFTHCGTIRHAGYKFGRWLDLEFYQYLLPTPAQPIEGTCER